MAVAVRTVSAEDVVRDAMPATPSEQKAWLQDATASVRRHGAIIVRNAIPAEVVNAVLEDFKVRHDVHMASGQKALYRRFQDDPLRAQVPIAIDGSVANPAFFAAPSILAIVKEMMGEELIIGEMGVVISHPGAGPQILHRDSNFLFGGLDSEIDLPPFAMTLLIDARVFHRGGANVSGPVRPTVYFSFHRRWYVENPGYERKPQVRVTPAMLERLPQIYRPLFAWALHLNRTDSFSEFAYRWTGRVRGRLLRLKRA